MGDVNTVGKGTIDGARKQTPNTCIGEASVEEISSYHRAPESLRSGRRGRPGRLGPCASLFWGEDLLSYKQWEVLLLPGRSNNCRRVWMGCARY